MKFDEMCAEQIHATDAKSRAADLNVCQHRSKQYAQRFLVITISCQLINFFINGIKANRMKFDEMCAEKIHAADAKSRAADLNGMPT